MLRCENYSFVPLEFVSSSTWRQSWRECICWTVETCCDKRSQSYPRHVRSPVRVWYPMVSNKVAPLRNVKHVRESVYVQFLLRAGLLCFIGFLHGRSLNLLSVQKSLFGPNCLSLQWIFLNLFIQSLGVIFKIGTDKFRTISVKICVLPCKHLWKIAMETLQTFRVSTTRLEFCQLVK